MLDTDETVDVLVKHTYAGDANLDGKINILDYTQIDAGVAAHMTGWSNGDFNYDGKINILDYAIIDSNLPTQGPPLGNASSAGAERLMSWKPSAGMESGGEKRDEDPAARVVDAVAELK
jgi:hypothetical protein